MPPKPKTPKKASQRKSRGGPDAEETARLLKQIEEQGVVIARQEAEMRREQEQRNFFQLERDKIHTLYEVAQAHLEEVKQRVQAKDRQVEELVESHQVAIRVYQQKIKDILYGNSQDAVRIKVSAEQSLRQEEDFHRAREDELLREVEQLKLKVKENQLSAQDMLRQQKESTAREAAIQRDNYEQQLWTAQRDFETKLRDVLQDAEVRRKAEVQETETAKNGHIAELVRKHQLNFEKMKKYYLDITTSNLDLIKALKDEGEELRKKQIANEQLMYDVAQENKRLTGPLQNALAEAEQLKKKNDDLQKANNQLQEAALSANQRAEVIKRLEWEMDLLKTSLRDVSLERDRLSDGFQSAIQDAEQAARFRETVLERRIVALKQEIELLTTKYNETVAAGHLDPAVAAAIGQQTDNVLEGKNRNIRELSFELARVMRLYNEALRVFRSKMIAAGLPTADMEGFRPFEVREDI